MRDEERVRRICNALNRDQFDALVCALPAYVLMTTGYWPVIGTSVCITNADGRQVVVVPEDEGDLAQLGWANINTYKPSTLYQIQTVTQAIAGPFANAARTLGITGGRIGFERGPASEPASYAGMNLFMGSMATVIHDGVPGANIAAADDLLAELAAVKTPLEVGRIRLSCGIAQQAFESASSVLHAGLTEAAAAAQFRSPLSVVGLAYDAVSRADGFVSCMSGPNSARASAAYARSSSRALQSGDLALVHCNSYVDGFWTDITRTYNIGEPTDRQLEIHEAVFAARAAALKAVRPGARACDVDLAARGKLARRGFEREFKHSTGHGVGFAAISANARPRIHPESDEILESGMVFNVEPAVYIDGFGGIRHCDMVAVTDIGVEVLTPFQSTPDDLVIRPDGLAERDRSVA